MQNVTIQQARVQLPPEWSFHACAAPLPGQGLPMTFRGQGMLPRPLPLHGHCTAHVAAQEMLWGITSQHRALCWFMHCFQQDCRGEPEGSFWLRNGNSGYLFICKDSDGRPRGQLLIPLSHAPLAPNSKQAAHRLCPLQQAWVTLLCTDLWRKDREFGSSLWNTFHTEWVPHLTGHWVLVDLRSYYNLQLCTAIYSPLSESTKCIITG